MRNLVSQASPARRVNGPQLALQFQGVCGGPVFQTLVKGRIFVSPQRAELSSATARLCLLSPHPLSQSTGGLSHSLSREDRGAFARVVLSWPQDHRPPTGAMIPADPLSPQGPGRPRPQGPKGS
jgi:hypothetical protein